MKHAERCGGRFVGYCALVGPPAKELDSRHARQPLHTSRYSIAGWFALGTEKWTFGIPVDFSYPVVSCILKAYFTGFNHVAPFRKKNTTPAVDGSSA